ncbi:DnaJ-domain-containing protein [Dentipellis sp. KUC8613]|nr:DnaJ-domain-containing protein [Dentipellis sp. KUC8613]
MTNKKMQKKKAQAKKAAQPSGSAQSPIDVDSPPESPIVESTDIPIPDDSDSPPAEPAPPKDPAVEAEALKEQGNTCFKAKKYGDAIDLYTQAIALVSTEPAYLTNRAAAYMALKKFRPALEDCQQAATLQSAAPSAKTLVRLARCQLALGSPTPALSTLRAALSVEPGNAAAADLQRKVLDLEAHLRNFEGAKARKEWGMARLALDRCLQSIEGEGGEIPSEWRLWRIELELARGNWEAANIAANDALRLQTNSPDVLTLRGLVLFLSGKLPQALQHVQSALRFDPGYEPAQRLRRRVKDVERLKEEGNQAFKAGRLEEALEKYGETLDRIGENEEEGKGGQIRATLLSNRATTLVKLSRHEEALVDTEASLALYPSSFKALRTRARINLHLEQFDASVADFKSAIEQAEFEGSDADVRSLRAELRKAEAALKRSKTKDYYKILGVSRECTEVEIKKAYRRESLKHHPDKGGDEEKFKLVVEANAVLSDPRRRERYDLGEDEDGLTDSGGMGGMPHMHQEDLANIFAQFGGGGFAFGGGGGGPGFHSHAW